jgi:hypothetical protein
VTPNSIQVWIGSGNLDHDASRTREITRGDFQTISTKAAIPTTMETIPLKMPPTVYNHKTPPTMPRTGDNTKAEMTAKISARTLSDFGELPAKTSSLQLLKKDI